MTARLACNAACEAARTLILAALVLFGAGAGAKAAGAGKAQNPDAHARQAAASARPAPLKSGIEFTGPEVRALQQDDFGNPGMLWVARGEKLWGEAAGRDRKACASCHGDAKTRMKGVATRYPALDPGARRLVNLEGRIMQCRERNQQAAPLA